MKNKKNKRGSKLSKTRNNDPREIHRASEMDKFPESRAQIRAVLGWEWEKLLSETRRRVSSIPPDKITDNARNMLAGQSLLLHLQQQHKSTLKGKDIRYENGSLYCRWCNHEITPKNVKSHEECRKKHGKRLKYERFKDEFEVSKSECWGKEIDEVAELVSSRTKYTKEELVKPIAPGTNITKAEAVVNEWDVKDGKLVKGP